MIAAALLASALAVGPPQLVTVGRCRWERPPAAVTAKATPPGAASGAVVARKPARKPRVASPTPPKPGDDFIGCDEDGPVWTSEITSVEFWPDDTPPVKEAKVETPAGGAPAAPAAPGTPATPAAPCECFAAGGGDFPTWWGWPPTTGGPVWIQPVTPSTPIPEPSSWALLAAGLVLLASWRRS